MNYSYHDSPIGRLLLAGDAAGLRRLHMDEARPWTIPNDWNERPTEFDKLRQQLDAYFAGSLQHFNITLAARGTAFQLAVWEALLAIPYGQTRSYAWVATQIGRPKAVRAVGAANGANPIAIVIPCHRVIGANGALTGYGGGLERKELLLRLEGALPLAAGSASSV